MPTEAPVRVIGAVTEMVACLLLKVDQSVEESCPVFTEEAMGRLKTKALVVEARLKIVPAVPVEIEIEGPVALLIEVIPELPLVEPQAQPDEVVEEAIKTNPLEQGALVW